MRHAWRHTILGLATVGGIIFAGCSTTTVVVTPSPTATATVAATTVPPTATTPTFPVKVFFSKHPDSDSDPTKVYAVNRVAPTSKVGTYALQQLIVGPSLTDAPGLYSQVKNALPGGTPAVGNDHCAAGTAFALTITAGVARMQFCTTTTSGGIGDDQRVETEIVTTLKQFPTVSTVKICTMDGDTFGNESGLKMPC